MEEKNMEMEMEQTREEAVPELRSEQEHHHSHHHRHHHSHHRHRHRHHRYRTKTAWKDTELYQLLKKHRSVLINVASCTLSLVLLIMMAVQFDRAQEQPNTDSVGISTTQSSIRIESDLFLQDVQLVGKPIMNYWNDTTGTSAYYVYRHMRRINSVWIEVSPFLIVTRSQGCRGMCPWRMRCWNCLKAKLLMI